MKKFIKVLFSLTIILAILSGCASQNTTDEYDNYSENNKSVITTEPTTQLTDLGFYNLDEFTDSNGNCVFIRISRYDSEYMYIPLDYIYGYLIKNGFIQRIENIEYDDNNTLISYKADSPYVYSVINNNGLSCANGLKNITINEKVALSDKIVVFKCNDGGHDCWYVPATMIDWSNLEFWVNEVGTKTYQIRI